MLPLLARKVLSMARRRHPVTERHSSLPPRYWLKVSPQTGMERTVEAELSSAGLDELLHPSRCVKVELGTDLAPDGRLVLTSFQLDSLRVYVGLQARIRRALEAKLPPDQENWDPEGESILGDVWSWLHVVSVDIDAQPEDPSDSSSFVISMDCDWDQEHLIRAEFRNGAFVQLDHS